MLEKIFDAFEKWFAPFYLTVIGGMLGICLNILFQTRLEWLGWIILCVPAAVGLVFGLWLVITENRQA